MSANQAGFPIAAMARVLGVSKAGYYAWLQRPPSAHAIGRRGLVEARQDRPCQFAPDLRGASRPCRSAWAWREAQPETDCPPDARGRVGGRQSSARRPDHNPAGQGRPPAARPTLVDRNFNAAAPNQLWVADITYVPTAAGFLYLAVVLDAWSRKIVGWSMANHLRTELVLDAMAMAVGQRRPKDVIHHSDQGSQYTSVAFGKRCGEAGVRPSMGSVGDAYDNAMAESFFSTLEAELLSRRRFASQAEARMACFSYIEGWYNPVRLHSGLGYRSPITYEADMQATMTKT